MRWRCVSLYLCLSQPTCEIWLNYQRPRHAAAPNVELLTDDCEFDDEKALDEVSDNEADVVEVEEDAQREDDDEMVCGSPFVLRRNGFYYVVM